MTSIQADQNVIYTIAEGKLTDEDYNRIIPLLQEKLKTYKKIRWYFEMRDFKGWSFSAMWRDIKFDFSNEEHLEKIAMVGDKKWEKELTVLMNVFTDADIKFFEIADRQQAQNWIKTLT